MKENSTIKGSRGESILEICGSHEGVRPKVRGDMHLNQLCASDIKELTMFSLSNTILLRGVRTSGLVDNATIRAKVTKRGLEKLERVINTKNLTRSGILSDNLSDEVGDCSDNLIVVTEKVDPTHTSVIINKHNIVTIT